MTRRTTVYDLQSQKGTRKWLQLHVDNAEEAAAAVEAGIGILSCEPDHHLEAIRSVPLRRTWRTVRFRKRPIRSI